MGSRSARGTGSRETVAVAHPTAITARPKRSIALTQSALMRAPLYATQCGAGPAQSDAEMWGRPLDPPEPRHGAAPRGPQVSGVPAPAVERLAGDAADAPLGRDPAGRRPGVASSQTFRTGGSVHGRTRAHRCVIPRDHPVAFASVARGDTSCRPTSH